MYNENVFCLFSLFLLRSTGQAKCRNSRIYQEKIDEQKYR
ncbi:hypothetical protein CLOM621_08143 [Clostridium sp. M62/1]|nr:hypothetical protein CLOM621_08143 [Clostridium sp. M62/1]